MNKNYVIATHILLACFANNAHAAAKTYGERICNNAGFKCYQVKINDSWDSLFENPRIKEVVKLLNRTNVTLKSKMIIAIPENLQKATKSSIAPFSHSRATGGRETLLISQSKLAWGAYDKTGKLINWGPMSGGRNYCPDVKRACKTVNGNFSVFKIKDENCKSKTYPLGEGGAAMPYCMFFHEGYAIHGGYKLPGYHDSHGCVRTYVKDAKWLNKNFIKLGTRVIVTN